MLHRYSQLLVVSTLLLITAGGLVTSTGSGLSVPDWPTSYGYSMFTFPLAYMVGGIFYEHGHRLIASTVGMLTIGLVAWLWLAEPRGWVKRLGFLALGAVVLQGVLGGLTVLFFLPPAVSIGHAGLAQIFFCLTVTIAVVTAPGWRAGYGATGDTADPTLRRMTLATAALVYVQILIGATMRHTDAGLAIPDFPLAFGHLIPPQWTPAIAIHFAHRVGALIVTLQILATVTYIWRHHRGRMELVRPAMCLLPLVAVQVTLGAFTVWSAKAVPINTAHVVTGAMVLGTSLVIALRAHRDAFAFGEDRLRAAAGVLQTSPVATR